MKSETNLFMRGFNPPSAEQEIHTLNLLLEIDKEYKMLRGLDAVTKAKREIKDRIKPSIYGSDIEKLNEIKEELFKKIGTYLEKHPEMPRCPFTEYMGVLQNASISPLGATGMGFNTLARNDNAIYKWKNNLGEWEGFNPETAKERIMTLNNSIRNYKKNKEGIQTGFDIFDGSM